VENIHARLAISALFPIDQIHELPGILSELELQLSFLVERDSIASLA
jgi:hypothetical protein